MSRVRWSQIQPSRVGSGQIEPGGHLIKCMLINVEENYVFVNATVRSSMSNRSELGYIEQGRIKPSRPVVTHRSVWFLEASTLSSQRCPSFDAVVTTAPVPLACDLRPVPVADEALTQPCGAVRLFSL